MFIYPSRCMCESINLPPRSTTQTGWRVHLPHDVHSIHVSREPQSAHPQCNIYSRWSKELLSGRILVLCQPAEGSSKP